jgi:hypothetical protein
LGAERGETRARDIGNPFVIWIGDDPEQFLNAIASDARRKIAAVGAVGRGGVVARQKTALAGFPEWSLLLRTNQSTSSTSVGASPSWPGPIRRRCRRKRRGK